MKLLKLLVNKKNMLNFLYSFFLYSFFSIIYQNSFSYHENENKFSYDSYLYKNYTSIIRRLGNCNNIEEYILYKTDISIITITNNINELIDIIGNCNNLKIDKEFLNSYINKELIYNEKMIVKYWYYLEKNLLLKTLKHNNNEILLQKLILEK